MYANRIFNKEGLDEGRKRYGSQVENTAKIECPYCGSGALSSRHQPDEANPEFECKSCGRKFRADELKNTPCPICIREEGAALEQHLIEQHGMDGRDAEVVARDMETRKNKAVANSGVDTSSLGYDYATKTTEMTRGKACPKCGHTIGQVFADGVCPCDCHPRIQNSDCPACGTQIQNDAMEYHLEDFHSMSQGEASGVLNSLLENAGRLVVEGGDSDKVAFVECETCDIGIDESRIQRHLDDGHTVVKVMKVNNALREVENKSESDCPEGGEHDFKKRSDGKYKCEKCGVVVTIPED